jgi:hypothetical protein
MSIRTREDQRTARTLTDVSSSDHSVVVLVSLSMNVCPSSAEPSRAQFELSGRFRGITDGTIGPIEAPAPADPTTPCTAPPSHPIFSRSTRWPTSSVARAASRPRTSSPGKHHSSALAEERCADGLRGRRLTPILHACSCRQRRLVSPLPALSSLPAALVLPRLLHSPLAPAHPAAEDAPRDHGAARTAGIPAGVHSPHE